MIMTNWVFMCLVASWFILFAIYMLMKPKSKDMAIHCPYHEEKTPSCIVKNNYDCYCLSCGAKFNFADMVKEDLRKARWAEFKMRANNMMNEAEKQLHTVNRSI